MSAAQESADAHSFEDYNPVNRSLIPPHPVQRAVGFLLQPKRAATTSDTRAPWPRNGASYGSAVQPLRRTRQRRDLAERASSRLAAPAWPINVTSRSLAVS